MKLKFFILLSLASTLSFAVSIPNGSFTTFRMGWMLSHSQSCAAVCATQHAKTELEVFNAAAIHNQMVYPCKANATMTTPYAGTGLLYGNNFNTPTFANQCVVSTAAGTTLRYTTFYCLCEY